ncbi:MAG TPA: response regulator transcription factor [Actinomycetota bacterium]|jgi:DNA-binding NarL/FixJ family response regulator|nr:response regulator transcription factor [Actinomycetota bacterium]
MTERVPVFVYARDPISQAGIAAELRGRPELEVLSETEVDQADVAVVAADEVDDETLRVIKAIQRSGGPRVVLVVARPDDGGLVAAVEAGACGLLRRSEATPEILTRAVVAAAQGDGTVPPDLLGRLLSQVGRLQRHVLAPRGLTFSGLTERELGVLKLVAEGMDTAEIAQQLAYSERTIKNIIHDITTRFHLRNRSHAVAFALRQGLI